MTTSIFLEDEFMQSINRSVMVSMALLLAFTFASMTFVAVPAQSQDKIPGKITGNIGVVSKYVFRGWVESDQPAVQGGIDYSHPSGLYAGYWGSTLGDQSYTASNAGLATPTENDVYVGFAGSGGPVSYDIGVTQFTYLNSPANFDMTELGLSVGFGPFGVGTNYALNDGFHTEGDLYTTFSFSKTLVDDLGFSAKAGIYTADTDGAAEGLEDVVVGLSHPIGDSGASMSLQYVYANSDINATGNQVVMGFSHGFDMVN
jgi:uncharacterized protein (TIGR02001 family)